MINPKTVTFDEATHTYTDTKSGKVLPSVTQIVGAMYPHSLANIPKHILDNAAERGIITHSEIEAFEKNGVIGDSLAFSKYLALRNKYKWQEKATEVLISGKIGKTKYAGRLDKIIHYQGSDCVADVKNVNDVHIPKARLQLSLYSHAAGLKSDVGYLIQLPLQERPPKFEPVSLYSEQDLKAIISKYEAGETLENPQEKAIIAAENALRNVSSKDIQALANLLDSIKDFEAKVQDIKERIFAEMAMRNIEALSIPGYTLTAVKPSVRTVVDSAKLKNEYPEVFSKVSKDAEVKAHLRVGKAGKEVTK